MSGGAAAEFTDAETGSSTGLTNRSRMNGMNGCWDSTSCVADAVRYVQTDAPAPTPEPSEHRARQESLPATAEFFLGLGGHSEPQAGQPAATHMGRPWGINVMRYEHSGLRYGFEWINYVSRYETPSVLRAQSYRAEMELEVLGVGGKLGYFARLGPAEIYADGGLGLYFSTMTVSRPSVLLALFGVVDKIEEKSNDPGADAGAGFALNLGKLRLGCEVRRLSLKGSFGRLSNNGSMPIGGKFALMTVGFAFPGRR